MSDFGIWDQRQQMADKMAARKTATATASAAAHPVPGAPAAPGAAPATPTAPQSVIGSAPPWLQTQKVGTPVGTNVTLTNVDMGGLPDVPTDFSGDAQRGADAAYKGATQFFDEDFGRDRSALESHLINQGFAPGSEAFNNEMGRMQRGQDAARENAAFQAQGVGFAQSGDLLQRALAARAASLGERTNMADRIYGQTMGVANLALGSKGQDTAAKAAISSSGASAGASRYATDAGRDKASLDAELALRNLGLASNNQDFTQAMAMAQMARGGVNMPNFGNPAPLDVGSAYGIASNNSNAAAGRDASDRAGLYGLGAAALNGIGRSFGGYG
jgi:hypothetical protein